MNQRGLLSLIFAISLLPVMTGAESRAELEQRRDRLREEIRTTAEALGPLVEPWLQSRDLHVLISARPLLALVEDLNSLPDADRTTHVSVSDHSGQIAGEDRGCTVGPCPLCASGRQGWFVEFKDPNFRAWSDTKLSELQASWQPDQGPRIELRLDLKAEIGTLHGHWDPECLTGGVGLDIGPAVCTGNGNIAATLAFGSLQGDQWRYSLRAVTSGVSASCTVSAGSLGDIPFGIHEAVPRTEVALDGVFRIPLTQEGILSIPSTPAQKLAYHLDLTEATAAPTGGGLLLESDVVIDWN